MFDQLIWYFCLAFSSACACAGQPLPCTTGPARPLSVPHPGSSWAQSWAPLQQGQWLPQNSPFPCSGCNLLAAPGQAPTQPFPSSFKRREMKLVALCLAHGCRDSRLHGLWLQAPVLCSCSLLLGFGWESSAVTVPGAPLLAPALPAPWPHPCC